MKEKEKISRCTAVKAGGKRKKSRAPIVPGPNLPASLDEEWLKANTALSCCNSNGGAPFDCSSNENLQLIKSVVESIGNRITLVMESTPAFTELLTTLKNLLKTENLDAEIASNVCDILLTLCEKNVTKLEPEDYVTVIYVLLEHGGLNHEEKRSISLVKKLRKLISQVLESEELKTNYLTTTNKAKMLPAARKLLADTRFYATESNRDIIAGMLALHEELLKEFHDKNKRFLINCKRTEASAIGKIYHKVWEWASSDSEKKFLEEECIQWLMDRAFTLGRQDASVRNLSLNLQSLLSSLHNCRKKAKFSKVITTLYTPLLWKYLNSDNNVHRCNAAEIFMDVYPLEKPTEGKKVYSQFLRQQHEQMLSLLDDACPAVRVIAIRGACSNLKYFWATFQNGTAEEIIKKFVTDLVVDGSSAEVRKAVYHGLTQLLDCADSRPLLRGVLPTLSEFVNDENPAVRQAFIKMLIKIKELQCEIKYWQVFNLHTAASRLENDNASNRQLIVRLIFSSFVNSKVPLEETFKRLCKFISLNSSASRYLALYSKNVLSLEKAVELMCTLLLIIRNYVKKKMNVVTDENKNADDGEKPDRRRKTKSVVLASIENVSDAAGMSTDEDSVSGEPTSGNDNTPKSGSISDPYIAHGLFDFVSMLWLIHGNKLLEEEHKEHLEKLYSIAVKCVCLSLRYFKDTHAFFGALYMAGMMPFSKLQYTTTILGICLSMLRQINEESQVAEYHCVVHVLCLWNKGGEILDLVKEWLDEALRAENLNESFCRRESKRIRKVKFASTGVRKPLLALNIVDELFASPTDQQCIFLKNRADLEDFLNYLFRIRALVERRLRKGNELNELLNDELLEKCLTLYGNLIIMFQENNVTNFNFWQQFSDYLQWCTRTLVNGESAAVACQDEEKIKFVAKLLQVSLMQCWNILALGKCTDEQLIVLIEYYLLVLNSDSGMYAIELTIYFTRQLIKYSRAHHLDNRQNEIMTVWFPRLLDKILTLLTDKMYTRDMLLPFVKDLVTVRTNLIFTYLLVIKTYPDLFHYSNLSYKIMCTFCKHLINIFIFPIKECEVLNVDESCKSLPYVGSLLTNVLISQMELASAFLYVLKTIVNRFTETDALQLLATASLLYTLSSFGDNKVRKSEIMKIVKITYNKLQTITDEEGSLALVMNCEQTIGDRTIIDVQDTTKLAVKEVGKHILKLITERIGGSLS